MIVQQEVKPGQIPTEPMSTQLIGVVLVPDVVAKTPPFLDRVIPGSAAERLGLAKDDLVIEIDGKMIPDVRELKKQLKQIDRDAEFEMTIQRDGKFVTLKIQLVE